MNKNSQLENSDQTTSISLLTYSTRSYWNKYKLSRAERYSAFEKVELEMNIELLNNLKKDGLITFDDQEEQKLTRFIRILDGTYYLTAKITNILGESVILNSMSGCSITQANQSTEIWHDVTDMLIKKICSSLGIDENDFYVLYIHSLKKGSAFSILDKFCQQQFSEDSPMTKKVRLSVTDYSEEQFNNKLKDAKIAVMKNNNIERHSSNPYLCVLAQFDIPETNASHEKYCKNTINSYKKTIFRNAFHKKMKDNSIIVKIFKYAADPVLNFSITMVSLGMLSYTAYERFSQNTNDLPSANVLAKITTIMQLSALFLQMVTYLLNFNSIRKAVFVSLHIMVETFQCNKNIADKCHLFLVEYKKNTIKCYRKNLYALSVFGVVFRGIAVNVPFNLTNIPNDPAALLGISNLTTALLLSPFGLGEIATSYNMYKMNKEVIELSDCILSSTSVEELENIIAKHKKQMSTNNIVRKNKRHKNFIIFASFIVSCNSLYSIAHMIYNASHEEYQNSNGLLNNYTASTDTNITGNTLMHYAEKLYYNQSVGTVMTISTIALVCKSLSTVAVYNNLCRNVTEKKVVVCNVARYICTFISSVTNALWGTIPGVPDIANALDASGTVGCALIQNNIKDELKFECTNIENLANTQTSTRDYT